MVAIAEPPRRGRPAKDVKADQQIGFRIEPHIKVILDQLPMKERRGYFRKLVKKDLVRRGLLDRSELAG